MTKNDDFTNRHFYGTEPEYPPGHVITPVELVKALNWYNSVCDVKESRLFLSDFIRDNFEEGHAWGPLVPRIPDEFFPKTSAWVCRLLSRGIKINDTDLLERMTIRIQNSLQYVKPEPENKVVPDVQKYIREKVSNVVGELHGIIDDGNSEEFSTYEYLQKIELPPNLASRVRERLEKALEGATEKDVRAAYTRMIDDLARYASNTKKMRPRKRKAISIDKKLAKFQYMKESSEYRLASIDPAKIIGAREVWLFQTRYRTLTVLRASEHDSTGLDIKGTTIKNYNDSDSYSYRTGHFKRGKEILEKILKDTRPTLKKLGGTLKTTTLKDRSGTETLVLRTF